MEAEKRTAWRSRQQRYGVEFVVQTSTESGQWETLIQAKTAEEAAAEARTWVEHWESIVHDFEAMDNELPEMFRVENEERDRLAGIGGDDED